MLFWTRDLVRLPAHTLINALRAHLAEHGVIAPQGATNVKVLKTRPAGRRDGMALSLTDRLFSDMIEALEWTLR